MRIAHALFFALAIGLGLTLVACGGGGGGSAPAPVPTSTVTPQGPLLFPLASGATTPAAGTIGVAQAQANFTVLGQTLTYLITEDGQTVPFVVTACTNKAPVTFNFQYPGVSNGAQIVTISAIKAGSCVMSFTDSSGLSASILIQVTTTTGAVS